MNPTLLITCIRCARLHVPASFLALHPVCAACSRPSGLRARMT
jgi:hypothetical protein